MMKMKPEQYTLPNGETFTLTEISPVQFEIACWDANDENRWTVYKPTEAEARKEFERWKK